MAPYESTVDLAELSDRQWHSYEIIDGELKQRIENWIEKSWVLDSEEYIRSIIFVIGALGLRGGFELEDNVDNPYSGMK